MLILENNTDRTLPITYSKTERDLTEKYISVFFTNHAHQPGFAPIAKHSKRPLQALVAAVCFDDFVRNAIVGTKTNWRRGVGRQVFHKK